MEEVFQAVLTLSINASWLIVAVLLLRALLWKAPKGLCYVLWAFVGIRLLCPITIESDFSLVPSQETITENVMAPTYTNQNEVVPNQPEGGIGENLNPNIGTNLGDVSVDLDENCPNIDIERSSSIKNLLPIVWIVGMSAILVYAVLNYFMLRSRVAASVCVEDNLWICDEIQSPFILGMARPRIYIPSYIDEEQKPFILAHEKEHLRYYDHLWKPLGFLILAIHWFNPLVWLSYILMCRDIEYACDERVISQMNHEEKKKYTESLLLCSSPRHFISACPVAFGEVGIKERIKSIIKYQKPATWIVGIGILACVIVAICFMTNQGDRDAGEGTEGTEVVGTETEGTEIQGAETEATEDSGNEIVEDNTEDLDGENGYVESVFYETTADLNHDGIEDLVQTVLLIEKSRYAKVRTFSPRSKFQNCDAVVKVYLGLDKQGEYEKTPAYVTEPVNDYDKICTYALTQKDGKDYLIRSHMHQTFEWSMYTYQVMCITENNEVKVVTNNDAQFVTNIFSEDWNDNNGRREDVIPAFKEELTPWIENGIILVSHESYPDLLYSAAGAEVPANVHYDQVWARKNESEWEKELEAAVGPEKWKQYLYVDGDREQKTISIIENNIMPNCAKYFEAYDGSKLQRIERCGYGSICTHGISTNCDIIYYKTEPNEDVQSVLYKMIEAMILPRMEESNERPYTITEYAIKESPVIKISDNMWLVQWINGYYKYDGADLVTFEEYMKYEGAFAVDGLLPFMRQGSDGVFNYILIEKDGVYRLEHRDQLMR